MINIFLYDYRLNNDEVYNSMRIEFFIDKDVLIIKNNIIILFR